MTPFKVDFATVAIRFYLMMAVVILAGFVGVWPLGLLGLPIFLTGILGTANDKNKAVEVIDTKQVIMLKPNPGKAA